MELAEIVGTLMASSAKSRKTAIPHDQTYYLDVVVPCLRSRKKLEFAAVPLSASLIYNYCFQTSGILNCYKQCMVISASLQT